MLGEIVDGVMVPNRLGQMAGENLLAIPRHVKEADVRKYIVMPNHVHMILSIKADVSAASGGTQRPRSSLSVCDKSKQIVPKTIQLLKASVSRSSQAEALWQSRYYDHIIRGEDDYQKIWQYIDTNPIKWELDRFYRRMTRVPE